MNRPEMDPAYATVLPSPGVSIEVSVGLLREPGALWGHLRFDRDGLRFRPRGAGGCVRLALGEIDAIRFGAGWTLEVDARGQTWAWTGEGCRRIRAALEAACGVAAA